MLAFGQVAKKSGDARTAEVCGVLFVVKEDVAPDPMALGFLHGVSVMPHSHGGAYLIH